MNYYVLDSENNIALFDSDKKRLKTTLKYKPDLTDAKIHQTTREIVELDGAFVFADEHEEEIAEQEALAEEQRREAELQAAIDELSKEMDKAELNGDEEWKADLRAEYAKLMEDA